MQNVSTLSNEDVGDTAKYMAFSWIDYTLFLLMFGLSILIGVYFGCFGSKQKSKADYLLGGKTMGTFPVAMSLTASHISGISLLGIPAEIYMYGTQYWMCTVSVIITGIIMACIYLPVFHKLQLTSNFEYLNLRFDDSTRKMASVLYTLNSLLYIPIVIYIPALAFNQVTGLKIHYVAPFICLLCIFYTTIGGLKAVVWSDTLQFTVTLGAMFMVLIMGIASAGGFQAIWDKAERGQRLEFFNMDLDPTVRGSFYHIVIGITVQWVAMLGVNPASVQRFLAVPTMHHAKIVLVFFVVGTVITKSASIFSGLIMFAKYSDCDPSLTGEIGRPDQLLPYYVLDVASSVPGLSGLFIAGVFTTALSAMSTNLNTLSGTIYEDFVLPASDREFSEKSVNTIMKMTVVIVGLVCVGLVYVIQHLGGVFQICMSLSGIGTGPLLGLFTLGMLFPAANTKGALCGSMAGLVTVAWICVGAQLHIVQKNIVYEPKPLSVAGCNATINLSDTESRGIDEPLWIYKISFYYYAVIGLLITIPVGLFVSWMTNERPPSVHKDLLSPCIHRFLSKDRPESKKSPVTKPMEYFAENERLFLDCVEKKQENIKCNC